jgi:hypothetical protein
VGSATETLTIGTSVGSGPGGAGPTGPGRQLTLSLSAARFSISRGKRVRVSFLLSGPATVTLTVLRGKGVVAKLSTTLRRAGRGLLTWNGKIKRKLAPTGAYNIVVRAVSPVGASAHASAALRIK